eukprot:4188422-Pleurochrysis_carterae.AAC.2
MRWAARRPRAAVAARTPRHPPRRPRACNTGTALRDACAAPRLDLAAAARISTADHACLTGQVRWPRQRDRPSGSGGPRDHSPVTDRAPRSTQRA